MPFLGWSAQGSIFAGGSWDHERWGGELPHRDSIDEVTPANPVLVHRLDLHMGLANTRALEEAALTACTRIAARAGFAEGFSGSLIAGKVADFSVLEGDLLSTPETELDTVSVSRTFVEGEEVYRKGP